MALLREAAPHAIRDLNGDTGQPLFAVYPQSPFAEFAENFEGINNLPPELVSRETEFLDLYQIVTDRYPGKLPPEMFASDGYSPSLDYVYDEQGNPFTIARRCELRIFPGNELVKNEGALAITKKVFSGSLSEDELPRDGRNLQGVMHMRDHDWGALTVAAYEELRVAPGEELVDIHGPYKVTIRIHSQRPDAARYQDDSFDPDFIYAYKDMKYGEVAIMMKTELRIVPGSQTQEVEVDIDGHDIWVRRMWIEGHHDKNAFGDQHVPHRMTHVRGLKNEPQTQIDYYLV